MNRKIKALSVVIFIAGTSFAQGNGNSGTTPADTTANSNSQSSLRWKLNGNQIQGAEFIGTTNQKDLIFKSNNVEGLRITPGKIMEIPGQLYMELHRPTVPGEQRFLTIDYNGKIESMEKSGLIGALYANPCKETTLNGTTTYTPIWASTTGILWTGDACAPASVGINTNAPQAALDVMGQAHISGGLGIGTTPATNSALAIRQVNPTYDGVSITFDPATNNSTGVGVRIAADNAQRRAISVYNSANHEVFNVTGNGNMNLLNSGTLNFDGTQPDWNTWKASIITPDGGAWVTSNANADGYYSGLGITTTGLFYGKSTNSPSSNGSSDIKYLFSVDMNGEVHCRAVKVDLYGWSDFVFDNNYTLMPLDRLQEYINANNHLPGIPSEQKLQEEGLDLAEMQKLQMQKIEELTLYILQLEQRINELEVENE